MRRRTFIAGACATAARPLGARGQTTDRVRRIGVVMPFTAGDPQSPDRIATLSAELQQFGWTVGRNLRVEYRWGADAAEVQRYVAELIALNPDLILATGGATMGP